METDGHNNVKLTKRERRELRRQEKKQKEVALEQSKKVSQWKKRLAILLVAIVAIAGFSLYEGDKPTAPVSEKVTSMPDDWIKGNKEAQVTLVEYLDFECEACGAYYPVVKRLSEEFGAEVKFVNKYFPLPGHKNSMTSALAVEAAGRQGKYWEMHNLLFENQRDWGEKQAPDPKIFENYAKSIGLDMEQYTRDIASPELKARIERDRKEGQKLGLSGTPSFYLNGKKIENPRGYEDFKALIQAELAKTQSGSDSPQ